MEYTNDLLLADSRGIALNGDINSIVEQWTNMFSLRFDTYAYSHLVTYLVSPWQLMYSHTAGKLLELSQFSEVAKLTIDLSIN